jgi:acyl-CoA thioesterase-1
MEFLFVRRYFIVLHAALSLGGLSTAATVVSKSSDGTARMLIVGDSLSAEYGLKRGTGWVALLEQRLLQERIVVKVINASISGDTTSGGRSRLITLLTQHRPTLVVIELGANDALRGMPLNMTQDNLRAMTLASQAVGAKVLLLGMQMPPNYGKDYSQKFAATYAEVAKSTNAALVPFMLSGVADGPRAEHLFQKDRIHPLEEAHPLILDHIWPTLKKLIT